MYNICAPSVIKDSNATFFFLSIFFFLMIRLISIIVLPVYSSKAWCLFSTVGGSAGQGEGTKALSKVGVNTFLFFYFLCLEDIMLGSLTTVLPGHIAMN